MKRLRFPLGAQLLIALILGCSIGWVAGPRAEALGEAGMVIVILLKTLAAPLVFLAIVDAFCKTHIGARQGARLLGFSTLNAVVATIIALSVCHFFPAQNYVSLTEIGRAIAVPPLGEPSVAPRLTTGGLLHSLVPNYVLEPLVTNNVLAVVFLSVLFGAAIRAVKRQAEFAAGVSIIETLVASGLAIISKILEWVVRLVPLAVLCIVAKVVGTTGFGVFRALGFFVILVAGGMIIQVGLYYSVLLWTLGKTPPWTFFRAGFEALMTAMSTGSSLATLPVTLKTLQEKMRVSTSSSRLAACVGTNFNHVGILLYEAVAALFIAQIQGLSLTPAQQVSMVTTSALAAVGIAGIPDAGLITLSLVLSAVGLPLTAVPLLLPVDWLIGRFRATTNVASDMTVAVLLDKVD